MLHFAGIDLSGMPRVVGFDLHRLVTAPARYSPESEEQRQAVQRIPGEILALLKLVDIEVIWISGSFDYRLRHRKRYNHTIYLHDNMAGSCNCWREAVAELMETD